MRHTFCWHLAARSAPERESRNLPDTGSFAQRSDMHLSPAALDSAIRLLDQPMTVQSFGDILETGRVFEEKIYG